MKKKSLTLLLPSLLSGCTAFNATPVPDTTPPALVFVDGQIRESAAIIAHTQKRLLPPPVTRPVILPETPDILFIPTSQFFTGQQTVKQFLSHIWYVFSQTHKHRPALRKHGCRSVACACAEKWSGRWHQHHWFFRGLYARRDGDEMALAQAYGSRR